ncbi:hypothetical protein [Desulforegula conservatrix]|uniref:hypothetical protein n=1 Tax=Desulforegula conservatrix TaxID=153026 RepID=UPI0004142583|nr:hypothetical protein [Desulforegula conservatrix]
MEVDCSRKDEFVQMVDSLDRKSGIDANLVIDFSENIAFGSSGSIILHKVFK